MRLDRFIVQLPSFYDGAPAKFRPILACTDHPVDPSGFPIAMNALQQVARWSLKKRWEHKCDSKRVNVGLTRRRSMPFE